MNRNTLNLGFGANAFGYRGRFPKKGLLERVTELRNYKVASNVATLIEVPTITTVITY